MFLFGNLPSHGLLATYEVTTITNGVIAITEGDNCFHGGAN